MPTPEITIGISVGGSILVAALPKIIDLLLGDRIARRRDEVDRCKAELAAEEAYRAAIFAAAREDAEGLRARYQEDAGLRQRIRELEAMLSGRKPPEPPPATG